MAMAYGIKISSRDMESAERFLQNNDIPFSYSGWDELLVETRRDLERLEGFLKHLANT